MNGAAGDVLAASLALATLRSLAPVLLAALGGLVSSLAGCVNVALEGLMLVAAFFAVMGAWVAQRCCPGLAGWACAWIGCGAGVAAALACAGVLAVFHLEWGADLIVAGIAVNLLAQGLTVFLLQAAVGDKGSTAAIATPALPSLHVPGLGGVPALDLLVNGEDGRGQHVLVLAALACALALPVLLARTRFGLRLRAVGENEHAARGAGVAVKATRYRALLAGGALAGLGGSYLSLGYLTLFQADMSAGRGFLALAAVFLGRGRVLGTFAAALLFGAASVLATRLGARGLSVHATAMLPPLVTIATLVVAGALRRRRLSSREE
jgi:simple sugar transport system permease protein